VLPDVGGHAQLVELTPVEDPVVLFGDAAHVSVVLTHAATDGEHACASRSRTFRRQLGGIGPLN
jgi:hypothetical protein